MFPSSEVFKLIVALPSEPVFRYFLEFYHEDIVRNQPDFTGELPPVARVVLVMRDVVPAGILVGCVRGTSFEILLDYVSPAFRDFKISHFLFEENRSYFVKMGCNRLLARTSTSEHRGYLEQIGFKDASDGWLERSI